MRVTMEHVPIAPWPLRQWGGMDASIVLIRAEAVLKQTGETAGRKPLCNPYSYDHGKLVINGRVPL
jgi:hypothetical protein